MEHQGQQQQQQHQQEDEEDVNRLEDQQQQEQEIDDGDDDDDDDDDDDQSMSLDEDDEQRIRPAAAEAAAASFPQHREHDEPEIPSIATTGGAVASNRKRSHPTSNNGDGGTCNTLKHSRTDGCGGGGGFLEDDESLTSILQVTSLDELFLQRKDLLFYPPEWLKSQLFMEDDETMLHYTIRKNIKHAAMILIQNDETGQYIHGETSKGVTPLILAAQKGNLECVQLLLDRGAKVGHVTVQGTTAVLQAAHFGHFEILKLLLQHPSDGSATNQQHAAVAAAMGANPTTNLRLIELSNFHHTTPLMRAAQEGHLDIVKYLVERGALVNRKNRQCMTALMLASQRGHAKVCEYLIKVGHADMDATTESKSTPLLVACKRNHYDTIQVLVTAGCELFTTDSRGRTAYDIAIARLQNPNGGENSDTRKLLTMLNPTYQVHCMRQAARQERSYTIMYMWNLLQRERATLRNCMLHEWVPYLRGEDTRRPPGSGGAYWKQSTLALLRTMTLPESLVQNICEYIPMPTLWDTRISMLTKRALVNPNAALECGLDLMDEVLEQGGFLQVLDQACIPPLEGHAGWTQWKRSNHCSPKVASIAEHNNNSASSRHQQRDRPNATIAQVPFPSNGVPSLVELRRHAGYLQILSAHATEIVPILTSAPYHMPPIIAQQLVTSSDIASLVRRVGSRGGVHFDTPIALDFIMLTSRLCSWYYSFWNDEP